jgi:hypothetical protein
VSRLLDIDELSASEKDEWAHLLSREAARDRRTLTTTEAYEAFLAAPLTGGWVNSHLADVGRIRIATHRLIVVDRWRPDQIVLAMTTLAIHVCPEKGIAELAIADGIEDALEILMRDASEAAEAA